MGVRVLPRSVCFTQSKPTMPIKAAWILRLVFHPRHGLPRTSASSFRLYSIMMKLWSAIGVAGVLQPPKCTESYKRANNTCMRKTSSYRRCKVAAGSDKQETVGSDSTRGMPSLPFTVWAKLAAFSAVQLPNGGIRPALFSIGDRRAPAMPGPNVSGVRTADIDIDASNGLWVRVFSPSAVAGNAPLPVVVYFHGGGFVLFSAASRLYDAFCRRLCLGLGAVVVSVNYRLAPQHRFPAAYDDGIATLRYLDANALPADLVPVPVDVSNCFLAGDSAGGNIAHHVAQCWASMSSMSPPENIRLAGSVLIQPLFGGEERTEAEVELANACSSLTLANADFCWKQFLPEGATRDHVAAHVCGGDVNIAEAYPPAMVVVGGFDLLKDRHARYVEELRRHGKLGRVVEYPDAIHGFYLFPEIDDSAKIVGDIKIFVDEHRSKPVV
ncbi:hypothetical protein ACP70R_023291 [Stipagrostis hirtigluma subsp. patula]